MYSSDIWSCAIIMYRLCSNGEHPLYEKGDTASTYVEKLRDPEWKFGPGFSKYAIESSSCGNLISFFAVFLQACGKPLPYALKEGPDRALLGKRGANAPMGDS